MKREWFTPEKLSFYFYQAMVGMLYLHQQNLFFSDMKPANLLIFRNQQAKMGDFGVSIKLNDDIKDETEKIYYGKGQTKGFCTQEYLEACNNEEPLSKAQLFASDKYGLIRTFEVAIEKVQLLV